MNESDRIKIWKELSVNFSLIPLALKTKRPIEKNWPQWCEKKRPFFPASFKNKNAGVATGLASNCIVLDIDDAEKFESNCKKNGWKIPETFTVETGSGNHHHYYRYPSDKNQVHRSRRFKKLGFDIQASKGQVTAPGSIHQDTGKPYKVVNHIPLAQPPAWILDFCKPKQKSKSKLRKHSTSTWNGDPESLSVSDDMFILIKNGKPKGERSEAMMSVLNALVGAGVSDTDIYGVFESQAIGEKYREKGANRESWLRPQIKKAEEYTSGNSRFEINDNPPPIDIFGDTTLAGRPDWSKGACPPLIEDFAIDESERLGTDVSMIAMPAITVAAAVIDDALKIQPKAHDTEWTEAPRIWCAIIAEPGLKKSPAIDKATKPLKHIEERLYNEDQLLMEKYLSDSTNYDRIKKKNKVSVADMPKKPPQRRTMVDDATIESLSEILKDNPGGVLCLKDELSGLVKSFDSYRPSNAVGKDRALYLELFNGGPKPIDRIKRGRIWIPNWSACILGGIQPGPMRRLVGKISDDGLIQRFLSIHVDSVEPGVDREPDYQIVAAYNGLIANLKALKPRSGKEVFEFSPEAQNERMKVSVIVQNVLVLPDTSPAFRAHMSKWEGIYARLCLIFHIVESVSRGEDYPPEWVSQQTAARAAKLMLDFLLPNSARFYLETLKDRKYLAHSRWVAGHILSKMMETITERDIYRAYRQLKGKSGEIQRAMRTLEVTGWVTPVRYNNIHKPNRWKVDDRVHSLFAARAEAEREKRELEKEKIYQATRVLGLDGREGS